MRTRLGAAFLAGLVLLAVATAGAKPSRSAASRAPVVTRLTVVPGVSLDVPHGWYACDRATGRLLGTPSPPTPVVEKACHPAEVGTTEIHVMNLAIDQPLSLIVHFNPRHELDEEMLRTATPQIASELSRIECASLVGGYKDQQENLLSCNFLPVTVGGHAALVGNLATQLLGSDKAAHVERIYFVPCDGGDLTLQFEAPAGSVWRSDPVVDGIVKSVAFATETSAPPTELVQLTPAPGVALSLPRGWMACDPPTNALLGGAPDPTGKLLSGCPTEATTDVRLMAHNPQILRNVTVEVGFKVEQPIVADTISHLTPDRLAQVQATQCKSTTDRVAASGGSVRSCVLTVEQLAGHPALMALVTQTAPPPLSDDETTRSYFVPYASGFVTISITAPTLTQASWQPIVDSLLQTIAIQ